MLALLLLVVFGLGMAFFATQNTAGTTITLAGNTFRGIPLYVTVIASLLFGIFVSWLISMVDAVSSFFTIHGKDTALSRSEKEIAKLKEENHQLELDNAALKGEKHVVVDHADEVKQEEASPSFAHRIKHNLGIAT